MSVCLSVCVCVRVRVFANFQAKQIALTFSEQISQKMDLGLEIQKTNVGIRIIILEILCQFSGKTNTLTFFYNITSSQNINTTKCTQCPKLQ